MGVAAAASCVVGVGMLLSLLLFLVIIWFPQLYQPRYAEFNGTFSHEKFVN
jgi:hypothetical protein